VIALYLVLAIPLAGGLFEAVFGQHRFAAVCNTVFCALGFIASLWLGWIILQRGTLGAVTDQFRVDSFNVYLVILTSFIGMTTSFFSQQYMAHDIASGRLASRRMRLYFFSFQSFIFTMLLALVTNNLGVLWVATEGATLATVLLVSLYRTPDSVEAAWKYFMLCGVGIALALFGTVLLYFAAAQIIPNPEEGILWANLIFYSSQLQPAIVVIAFVFLLVGYGTKVGLVPMHTWLPDAHSEGPTPMSAMLSGLLLNVAIYAIVRIKLIVDGSLVHNTGGYSPQLAGMLMMGFGMISFIVAGLFLHRQRDVKRLFSYSSIEHMGLITFAFGLGGPLATFAAQLHMVAHSLTKSALFFAVGHACHIAGTQSIERIRGLIKTQPAVGWLLLFGTLSIAGFPPFGIFTGEFMLVMATITKAPLLTAPLLIGLAVACAGLFRHIQPMVFGTAPEGQVVTHAYTWSLVVQLVLVLWLGLSVPGFLARWFDQTTQIITGVGLL